VRTAAIIEKSRHANFGSRAALARFDQSTQNIFRIIKTWFVANFPLFHLTYKFPRAATLNMRKWARTELWSKNAHFLTCLNSHALFSGSVGPNEKLMTPRESAFITASDRLFYHESQEKIWKVVGRTLEKLSLKDQVRCRIDVDGTKIFYHHEIEHLSKPRGSQNIRLVCLPWRLPKMVKCTKPLRGIENSKLRYLKNSSTIG
jgi:hypothetical protein